MKLQLILFAFLLGSAIAHPSNPFKKYQKIKTQGPICDICKYLITEIDSMLADDATIDEIIAALGPNHLLFLWQIFVKTLLRVSSSKC